MTRYLIILSAVFGACTERHQVELALGPADPGLSVGFRCLQDGTDMLMIARSLKAGNLVFSLVVDVIDLHGKVPGCRGEELLTSCEGGGCSIPVAYNPVRFCRELVIPFINVDTVRAALLEALQGAEIVHDAPDAAVLLRAVTTRQPCSEITGANAGEYVDLDVDLALGCAYSCPLQLDQTDGTVSLSLDTLSDRCESQVRLCAGLTAMP